MINMISQKLLPTIIRCSELSSVGALKFEVVTLTEVVSQESNNAFATKTSGLKAFS
jgi:hypothetical protein